MADKKGYEPITYQTFETAEEIARRNLARLRYEDERRKEADKRRKELLEEAQRQKLEAQRRNLDRGGSVPPEMQPGPGFIPSLSDPTMPRTVAPKAKSVNIDGVQKPIDEALADIPKQMTLEEQILSSPLKARALRRARVEELMRNGRTFQEAEAEAIKEQEKRQTAFDEGRKSIQKETNNPDKEARGFAESIATSVGGPVARIAGYEQAADEIEARNAGIQAELNQYRDENYAYPRVAGAVAGAAQNTAQMGVGVSASMIAGPQVGMAVMAGQYGAQEYSRAAYEGKEAGLAGNELHRYALVQGGVEASVMPIMSKIGLGGIEGRVLRQSIARGVASHPSMRAAIASGAKTLARDTAAEITEEVITEVLHGYATEKLMNQNVDYRRVIEDTVLQTIMMMGMGEATSKIGGSLGGGGTPVSPQAPANQPAPDVAAEQPVQDLALPPEVEAFLANPSRKKYEAAVKAGMPPGADTKTIEGRARYAEELRQARDMEAAMQQEQNQPAAPQDTATLEQTPEEPSGTVPDEDVDMMARMLEEGVPNEEGQQEQLQGQQGVQEQQQGGQEGLLEQPSTIDGEEAAAVPNESVPPAATPEMSWQERLYQENIDKAKALTKEEFRTKYLDTYKRMISYPPDQAGSNILSDEMAAMFDAQPEWADEIEAELPIVDTQTAPALASGDPSQGQPEPSLAGPASDTETQSEPELPKGAIGFNADGVPVYESKTGMRTVNGEDEGVKSLKTTKEGIRAVLYGPRQDSFKTREELEQEKIGTNYHSGLSRSPKEMDEAIKAGIPVGVSLFANLSAPMRKRLVDYANSGGKVFVDSGAFTALMKGKELDWNNVLFAYNELVNNVGEENRKNITIVAPDIVGNHQGTMDLQFDLRDKFVPLIESGATVIFPVQKGGHGSLSGNFADLTDTFGEMMDDVTVGIPFNAKAWSQDEVLEFMRDRDRQQEIFGGPVRPFHLLGGGQSKVEALIKAAQAEGLSVDGISGDAMPKKISENRSSGRRKKTESESTADNVADQPSPEFLALPQKSQDLFNKAMESKDIPSLKQMVDKSNRVWNKEFERRTGIKLPKTLKERYQAVIDWANSNAPVGEVILSPDLQLEQKREEDAAKRKQAISDGGFKVGDRVTQQSTGRTGVLQGISEKSGTVSVKFDNDGSVLSGTDVSGFERIEVTTEKRSETEKWGIYPTLVQGKPKFAVKEFDSGFGDALFDSEAEAKEYADTGRQRAAEKAEREAKAQAKQEEDQKKQQEHEASFQGFLTDDPMTKGRRLKTLDSSLNYKNKPTTRKALIEQKVADGWTVNSQSQLQAPTGEFLDERDLTKTGIDYAQHLVNIGREAEKPSEATTAEPTVEFTEMSKGVNAPGVLRTVRVTAGPRTLVMELNKKSYAWSIRESTAHTGKGKGKTPAKGKELAFGMIDLGKAKDVARRIIAGTFDSEADLVFQRSDTENIGYTNAEFGKEIKSEKNKDKFARVLRDENIATDGKVMIKVKDKDRDSILKAVGPTDEQAPLMRSPAQMFVSMDEAIKAGNTKALEIVGFRGGDITTRTIALKSDDGEITVVSKAYYDTVTRMYPKAVPILDGEKVVFTDNGNAIAMLMPMDIRESDAHLELMKKGNYPFRGDLEETAPAETPAESQSDPRAALREQLRQEMAAEVKRKAEEKAAKAEKAASKKADKPNSKKSEPFTFQEKRRIEDMIEVVGFDAAMERKKEALSKAEKELEKADSYSKPRILDNISSVKQSIELLERYAESQKPKESKPPKAKSAEKQTAEEKTQKAREKREAAAEAIRKKLQQMGRTTNAVLVPTDLELVKLVANYAIASMDLGIKKFSEFVVDFKETFGEKNVRELAPAVEEAWGLLPEFGYKVDTAGTVAEVLGPEGVKDDNAGTPDAGMGGMPGESGGTLAPETGIAPEDGEAESGTGQDDGSVPGGTDGTEGSESEGAGTNDAGTGTKQGAGTKRKPGRKPTVKGGRKPADSVSKPVGAAGNLRIQPDDVIAPSGVMGKLKANIAAIKLLKKLQAENRQATPEEQKVLMQYTGWGSLQHVFDKNKGDQFLIRPGLPEMYGEYYQKGLMYRKKDEYGATLDEMQKRVEAWEKQWGESYRFLKENLTAEEWSRAEASTLNAHFTSRDVITNGIWGALQQMGVTGGRLLEPSSGIGSFIGLMPEDIANSSEVIAIELDSLTGEMVKQLYPDADVYVKGFEEVPIPAGTIDIAATNVPFHKIGPSDAKVRYGREMNLHNYFIARMLDSLRPGGIAAVITTHFTMDANPEDRALLASKADLVAAIRLPNSAFKANAGTEVTTDILFFRKPDGAPFKGESWQNLTSVGTYQYKKKKGKKGPEVTVTGNITVNEYFNAHPEMVLGTHSMDGKQYSDTEYTVIPNKETTLVEQLQQAVKNIPANIANTNNAPEISMEFSGTSGVDGRIEYHKGKLQEFSKGEWVAPIWLKDAMTLTKDGKPLKSKDSTKAKNIANAMTQGIAYTRVRNAYENHIAVMRNENATQEEFEKSMKDLNTAYDAYRAKHGPLNEKASKWLRRDPGFFLSSGLEVEKESIVNGEMEKTFAKADVFTQRTINPTAAPESADTTEEAVKISLAWKGVISLPWMSELTGKSEEELENELLESGTVFKDPETSMIEPADTYLAGNVHAKLRTAEKAVADGDKRFERNVEALKEVQPPKRTIDSITPSLGQNWIPSEVVNRWLEKVVGVPGARVRYNEKADAWSFFFDYMPRDTQNEWGTSGMLLGELIQKTLNGTPIRVMKPDPNDHKKQIVDEAQTQATQIKAVKLQDSFEAWAKSDPKAIPIIEREFNEQKNFYVRPAYNGEHLTFPGMSDLWLSRMRPYQKNTIWRMIREGRGMIAHGVGAGKTVELIATAMEMKRLGTATKPLLVVQNSTLGQFARTFTEVYPAAKVLVAGKDDLNPENRAKFMARIATGNWDAIVMAKSTFNMKLPNDPSLEKAMVDGLIAQLEQVMLEAELEDGKGSPSVKSIQQSINSLKKRLDAIIARILARTDSDVFFEQMGIDALFLDEAHDYKKPPFVTKLDKKIKGLSTDVSGRALAALVKMRYVQDRNKGRNTFMATGTPITNTLGESWLLMSMVAPDVLKEFGVETFDQFVATFARVVSSLEQNAVGKLQRTTRLAKFKNGHQLAQFIQSAWDVILGEDLHAKIREYGGGKIPTMENGKETLHLVERTKAFDRFGEFFLSVYDAYKGLTGEAKKTYSWIPVVIYGAAKAAAIDMRLVDPTAPDDPGSKLNTMVNGVYDAYVEGTNVDLQVGDTVLKNQNLTQLIFSDVSGRTDTTRLRQFAEGVGVDLEVDEDGMSEEEEEADTEEKRWLYNEIKRKLIEKGIPEDQVQLINDHNKSADKLLALQDKVNRGEVRVVIGHSDTLGTGVNVQQRLKDVWELDIPMVPAKREQRLGRIIRSGNMNENVRAHVMAMQRSLDSTLMAMNLRKAKAAEQALSGKSGAEFDDPYSESLMSMADMEAAMNDDPLFYRQRELEFQIRQRSLEVEALDQQKSRERERFRSNEWWNEELRKEIAQTELQANMVEKALKDNPPFKVEGETIADRKKAATALKEAYDTEADKISKATQDSKIEKLEKYEYPKGDHFAADASFGPVTFTLVYGEYPRVEVQSDGTAKTVWVEASGTLVNIGKDQIVKTRATSLHTLMQALEEFPTETRAANENRKKNIEARTAENVKLQEFLSKPSEAQIELDNLQSQLNQVTQLMFERDNPGKVPPDPSIPITQETMPEGYQLVAPGELPTGKAFEGLPLKTNPVWHIYAPGGFTVSGTGGATAHEAYFKAMSDPEHGSKFPVLKKPTATAEAVPEQTPNQAALEKARKELEAQQLLNRQYWQAIVKDWQKVTSSTPFTGLPITKEMARNIANALMGSIRAGAKSFEIAIREIRANVSEEVLRDLKQNLIPTWNYFAPKFDLMPATEEAFEAALDATKDQDIEQAAEAAMGAQPATETTPAESQPDEGRLYSTKNAATDMERERFGMEPRVPLPRQSRPEQAATAAAIGKTESGRRRIDELIAEMSVSPRATSVLENDLLNFRYAELDQKREAALKAKMEARAKDDDAQVAVQDLIASDLLTQQMQLIELLSTTISYALGSGLQARKAWINTDYSMARMMLEYEAAYGERPSKPQQEAMQKLIDELTAAKEALEKKQQELQAENDDLQKRLKEAHDEKTTEAAKPAPAATPPATAPTETVVEGLKERGRKRVNAAKKVIADLLKQGFTFSIEGAVNEAGKALTELAIGYTEMGIATAADFLKQLKRDFGPSSEKIKVPALAAFNEVIKSSASAELEIITSKLDITDPDTIGRVARDLHSFVIRRDGLDASEAGRNAAVDAVHEILVDLMPELTKEETARAMSGIGVYSELSQDEAEVIRRDQKAQLLILEQIADWRKKQVPPATGRQHPPVSDEQRALRKLAEEAKKASGIATTTEGQLRSALDAAKRMAQNRIKDLDDAITSRTPIKRSEKILQPDQELLDLQAKRDAFQKLYDETFGRPELSDEQRLARAEKALDRAIADLEADLNAGKLYNDNTRAPLSSPALEAKRAQLEALKASREEMRLQSGEAQARSDAAYERHLREKDARLAQRIADNDFAPRPKKPERILTPEATKLMLAVKKKQQEINQKARQWEFDRKHPVYKAIVWGPITTSAIVRKLLTSIDQSLIGRQGYLLGITNPVIYGKSIRKAFPSNPFKALSIFTTEQDLFDVEAELDADTNWVRMEKIGKLAITGVHGGMSREEQNIGVPEWVNKIPGVGGSERAGSAFINTLRRLVFRSLVDKLSKTMDGKGKKISNADLRVIANLVNVSTGRGDINIKGVSQILTASSALFFSPRWWLSRLQWWTGQPVWHNSGWWGEGASTEVRQLVAIEMGKQVMAQGMIIGLVSAALAAAFGAPGDDEEWDFYWNPTHAKFGQMRVSNEYFDMTAGLGQHLSYFARVISGQHNDRWEEKETDKWRLSESYGRGKLAPIPSMYADYLAGSSMGGDKFGSYDWWLSKLLPLSSQDVTKAFKNEDIPLASAASVLMFFGVGAQSRDEEMKARKDAINEVRAAQKQNKPQSEILELMNRHFAEQAAIEAKEELRTAEPEQKAALEKVIAGTESPELDAAIEKEKGDLALIASVMLSTEDKTKGKSANDDKAIETARNLLKTIAPTYDEANAIYTDGYKRRNGSITEIVGSGSNKRFVLKKSVAQARRRLKMLYSE